MIPKNHFQNREAYKEGDFLKAWLYMKKFGKYYFSPNPAILDFLKVLSRMLTWQSYSILLLNIVFYLIYKLIYTLKSFLYSTCWGTVELRFIRSDKMIILMF